MRTSGVGAWATVLALACAPLSGVGSDSSSEPHWAYVKPTRTELPEWESSWTKNAIDSFILARMNGAGFEPSPEAPRDTLIRRLYLDLTGLPPSPEAVDAFLENQAPDAYESLVDRLLASPQYGERWARPWLDLARYADSNGYQRDGFRDVWAYRDWVINAFNVDLPFDRFTIEQIAGDLLPNPTLDQQIATGFHRCTTVNVEAGTDQEENRINQVFDRVNTTGTVWLGTTLECAQCHDHKYDPFSLKEYYSLFAYFNHTEIETAFRTPQATAAIDFIGPQLELPSPETKARRERWESQLTVLNQNIKNQTTQLVSVQPDWELDLLKSGEPNAPQAVAEALQFAPEQRTNPQATAVKNFYLNSNSVLAELKAQKASLTERLRLNPMPASLIMKDRSDPRITRVLKRGNFQNPGSEIIPETPAVLHRKPNGPANRLSFARWLVDQENPLAARVTVNRWWAEFFGAGIVTTLEDFGTQGEPPTHPDLLDWLAVEFMENGWSMKSIHRLIVTSATYRQSSKVNARHRESDPENKRYTRGPRLRLAAETIRDNALVAAGLLSLKQGGPPIRPYQPDGIWRVTGQVDNTYRISPGEDQHRRGVYVIWRRSAVYPSFVNFDAPVRGACVVQRSRSNTPLQALTLLNDPVYVAAAKALAERTILHSDSTTTKSKLVYAFRCCLSRSPRPDEINPLEALYLDRLQSFRERPDAATRLLDDYNLSPEVDRIEFAAWFYVASALLNLDETITKN